MEKEELKALFQKYQDGTCTEEEKALLEDWYLQYNEHEPDIPPERIVAIGKRIYRELPGNHPSFVSIGIKLAIAAIMLGLTITVVIKYVIPREKPDNMNYSNNILPGSNKAVLALADGSKIDLNNSAKGQVAAQSGVRILKTDSGQIIYQAAENKHSENASLSNTVSVPAGGQWQVALPDGTKVWLNSASSLTYPVTFQNQKTRIVRLTGEAYFEVAKDKSHPFIVKTDQQTVEVLGTHFNINAYEDEPSVKTTLAEGSVKISGNNGQTKMLVPGQQALLKEGLLTVVNVNVEQALAWKNGNFRFNDEDIGSIMRQLSRWYNIEVQYDRDVSKEGLNGKVSRSKNISQVLNALEATKTVHFKVEGRRVTVMK